MVECPIYTDTIEERFKETNKILSSMPAQSRTLVYFANASDIPKYVNLYRNAKYDDTQISSNTASFIDWMSNEIHPNWYIVKAMKRGVLPRRHTERRIKSQRNGFSRESELIKYLKNTEDNSWKRR